MAEDQPLGTWERVVAIPVEHRKTIATWLVGQAAQLQDLAALFGGPPRDAELTAEALRGAAVEIARAADPRPPNLAPKEQAAFAGDLLAVYSQPATAGR